MISMVQPLHVGNALRLFLKPPARATHWVVLRGTTPDLEMGAPDATEVYKGDEAIFIDTHYVVNGIPLRYRPFYFVDGAYVPSAGGYGIAESLYVEKTTDVLSFVRERLELGLRIECDRGVLAPELGYVQVINAAPALDESIRFPVVTVHLESDDPTEHGIGEMLAADAFNADSNAWDESEGWMSAARITVIGWSLNSDERIALRQAIRRVLIANLPLFADRGWLKVEFGQQDVDSVNGEFPVPMFQSLGNFTCEAPVVVGGGVSPVRAVETSQTTF